MKAVMTAATETIGAAAAVAKASPINEYSVEIVVSAPLTFTAHQHVYATSEDEAREKVQAMLDSDELADLKMTDESDCIEALYQDFQFNFDSETEVGNIELSEENVSPLTVFTETMKEFLNTIKSVNPDDYTEDERERMVGYLRLVLDSLDQWQAALDKATEGSK